MRAFIANAVKLKSLSLLTFKPLILLFALHMIGT